MRVFGVGAAKTGTHTIGALFADRVRAAHEADAQALIRLHLDRVDTGRDATLHRFLLDRDRSRRLRIDVSQVYVYLVDDLETLFDDARFIVTVREPVDWLRSIIDDSLRRDTSPVWKRFRTYRFGEPTDHPAPEDELARNGLHTISGYLGYWQFALTTVLDRIDPSKLLIVRTGDIDRDVARIAAWCGIATESTDAFRSARRYQNPTRSGVLERVDRLYLSTLVERLAGHTARRVFPAWNVDDDIRRSLG